MGFASPLTDLARVAVRDAYGSTVTYTPTSGSAVDVVGIHRRESVPLSLDGQGPPVLSTRELVDFREVDLGSIRPRTGDGITLNAVAYKVIDVERGPVGVVRCLIGRPA